MVQDDTIPFMESAHTRTTLHDLSCRLVACNGPRHISLRSFADMLTIDTADIRPADRSRLGFDYNFSVSRLRNIKFLKLHSTVPRKYCTDHFYCHDKPSSFVSVYPVL